MGIMKQLRNTVLLSLHERTQAVGAEDWLVCRIGSNRSIPEDAWMKINPDTVSYEVFSKICAFAPSGGFSTRQLRAMARLMDTLLDNEDEVTHRSRISPAIIRVVGDANWKACADLFSMFKRPFLVDEATSHLIRETQSFDYIPDGVANLLPKVIRANIMAIDTYLDKLPTGLPLPEQVALARHVKYLRWAMESLYEPGYLGEFPDTLKEANQASSRLMRVLAGGVEWLPRKDIQTVVSICRIEGLSLLVPKSEARPEQGTPKAPRM